MNTTRTTVPVAITVPITALLMTVVTFPFLGPAQAANTPRPEPGVSAVAPAAAQGGDVADVPGNPFRAKQQEILRRISGSARFDPAAVGGGPAPEVTNGVPRDLRGGAYLGKQQELLRHLY